MTKKEMKNYINQNWFYFHFNCDSLDKTEFNNFLNEIKEDKIETWITIPDSEDVLVFKWIISQNYKAGEKNRNGYKYNVKWFKFENYFKNPLVFYQHDSKQPIGRSVSFWWDKDKNLNTMFFVYKDALEWVEKVRVEKWLVKWLSTGAITIDYRFEDKDWKLLTEEEAEKEFWFNEIMNALFWESDELILYINEAEFFEQSLVTIGSNEDALAIQNWIAKFGEKKSIELKNKYQKNEIEEENQENEEEKKENEENQEVEEKQEEETAEISKENEANEEVITEEENEETGVNNEETEANNEETEDKTEVIEEKEPKTVVNYNITLKDNILAEIMPEITKNIIDKENNILEIEKNLANLKNDFTNSFNSLEDKIKELENVNSLLVDTIEVLNSKLKNTIFRSWAFYKETPKIAKSSLEKQLEELKQ